MVYRLMLERLFMCKCTFCRIFLHMLRDCWHLPGKLYDKPLKLMAFAGVGIGFAFNTLPKRSVTARVAQKRSSKGFRRQKKNNYKYKMFQIQ